jgi:hypothetical protein
MQKVVGSSPISRFPLQSQIWRGLTSQFIADLKGGGQGFHPRLRVKRVQGSPGIWKISWAPDGRATFQCREEVHQGKAHVVWRRIGSHAISRRP